MRSTHLLHFWDARAAPHSHVVVGETVVTLTRASNRCTLPTHMQFRRSFSSDLMHDFHLLLAYIHVL